MKTNPFSIEVCLWYIYNNEQIGFDKYLHIEATLTFEILQKKPNKPKKKKN